MSSVPKATRSTISDLTVVPESWDSYPTVDRCTIDRVQFEDLNDSSHLERSTLTDVTVKSYNKNNKRSNHIERSQLTCCTVAGAHIARCQLINSSITGSDHVERVEARDTHFVGARHVERSVCEESVILGKSCAQRSTAKKSVVADSSWVERSEVYSTVMTRSRVERSILNDCEVMNCQIDNTNFEGMTLKYGIWKDGDLVGRTCKEEVVVVPKLGVQRGNEERDDVGITPPSEHHPHLSPGRIGSGRVPDRSPTARYPPDKVGFEPRDGSVSPASSLSSRSTVSLVLFEATDREPPPSYESLHSAGVAKM